jgi:excisionase family DNA binding protein
MPRATAPPRKLITVDEAAARHRVHPKTIRRWIIAGRITGYRPPGCVRLVRVDQHELDAIFEPIPAAGR